ncbi:hypothetical protein [Acidocella aminolytica]|jgi:N-acetyl-gamma-glutamyl-phosphate reductase|nr:hypothetical protein [Acidocella aminolytica]
MSPWTKWTAGSNFSYATYATDPERNMVIAMGVAGNLGKRAAG